MVDEEGKQLRTKEQVGGVRCEVRLTTDEKSNPKVVVPVRAYLEQAVTLEKPAITFEGVRVKERGGTEVEFEVADGYRPEQVRVKVPSGAPLEVRVRAKDSRQGVLVVSWLGHASPGWHRHDVEVRPDGKSDSTATHLLVTAHVVPRVIVFPESIRVRDEELAKPWRRTITLDLPEGSTLRQAEFTDPDLNPVVTINREGVGRKQTLIISPRKEGLGTLLTGKVSDLIVHFTPESSMKIPTRFGTRASFAKQP